MLDDEQSNDIKATVDDVIPQKRIKNKTHIYDVRLSFHSPKYKLEKSFSFNFSATFNWRFLLIKFS